MAKKIPDDEMRGYALKMAVEAVGRSSDDVVLRAAEKFYEFLKGKPTKK